MTHRGADRLSDAIDRWLGGEEGSAGHLHEVMGILAEAFPEVADELARERVRRRVRSFKPTPRSPQELLVERAGDSLTRIARSLGGDEYVPWPTLAGAAAVVVAAAVVLAYLRRRGFQQPLGEV